MEYRGYWGSMGRTIQMVLCYDIASHWIPKSPQPARNGDYFLLKVRILYVFYYDFNKATIYLRGQSCFLVGRDMNVQHNS